MAWVAMGLSVEVLLLVLAAVVWLADDGYTLAEAGAVAVMTVFILLSLIHQVDLFTNTRLPGILAEGAIVAAVVLAGGHVCRRAMRLPSAVGRCFAAAPVPLCILTAAWIAMAGLLVAGWFMATGPAADGTVGAIASGGRAGAMALPPLNATALFFHATRFGLHPSACGLGLLAHVAIGLSTYALARRHAWPPMALTVTLVVLSMPRVVFLGLNPSGETITTTAAVVALMLLFRLVEQHRATDLWLFLLSTCFAIRTDPMSLALVAVLLLLLGVVMIRRHGWLLCRHLVTDRPWTALLMLIPVAATAQIPVLLLNLIHGQPLLGATVAFDTDGILGATANLLRYLLVSIDPTEPVHRALVWLVGLDLHHLVAGIETLTVARFFGQAGASAPFTPVFSGAGWMGFGPVAPLLALPAMGYALVRGTRRLKAVGVAWAGYLYLAALVVAWQPQSIAALSPLYATSGVMIAFSLPPWRLRRRGRRLLQGLCALLLAGSLMGAGGPPPRPADVRVPHRPSPEMARRRAGFGVEMAGDVEYKRGWPMALRPRAAAVRTPFPALSRGVPPYSSCCPPRMWICPAAGWTPPRWQRRCT